MGAVVTAEPYLSKNHAQPGQAPVHARRSRRGEGVRRGHLHGGAGDSVDRDYGWADASNLLSPPVLDLGGVWWIRYQPLDDSERGDLSWRTRRSSCTHTGHSRSS